MSWSPLLSKGYIDIPSVSPEVLTQELLESIILNNNPVVNFLTSIGADINGILPSGVTPVAHACIVDDFALFKQLLSRGANVVLLQITGKYLQHVQTLMEPVETETTVKTHVGPVNGMVNFKNKSWVVTQKPIEPPPDPGQLPESELVQLFIQDLNTRGLYNTIPLPRGMFGKCNCIIHYKVPTCKVEHNFESRSFMIGTIMKEMQNNNREYAKLLANNLKSPVVERSEWGV